jgi:low affinity Fe/Cu permease
MVTTVNTNVEAPTVTEYVLFQNNNIALSAIHDALDERTFKQIKNIEMAHEAWKKLEESFEGTQAVKGAYRSSRRSLQASK